MRIDGVSLRFVRIPFKHAFSHALKQRTEAETVLVTVRSTNGTTGIGEIVPRPYLTGETLESVLESIAPARARRCLGKVLSSEAEVVSFLRQELDGAGRELATLGGFELAVLDLAGKELGFQAASVLGPTVSPELPAGVVIGFEVKTPELKKHCALLRLSGKRHVKVKVGQPDDVERLEIVSAALGGIALRLDANGAWTSHEAIERLKLFASAFGSNRWSSPSRAKTGRTCAASGRRPASP